MGGLATTRNRENGISVSLWQGRRGGLRFQAQQRM